MMAADMVEFFNDLIFRSCKIIASLLLFVVHVRLLDELISCKFIECGGCDWDMFALTTYITWMKSFRTSFFAGR